MNNQGRAITLVLKITENCDTRVRQMVVVYGKPITISLQHRVAWLCKATIWSSDIISD